MEYLAYVFFTATVAVNTNAASQVHTVSGMVVPNRVLMAQMRQNGQMVRKKIARTIRTISLIIVLFIVR